MIVEVALLISKLYDVPEADDYRGKDVAPKGFIPEMNSWLYG